MLDLPDLGRAGGNAGRCLGPTADDTYFSWPLHSHNKRGMDFDRAEFCRRQKQR